MSHLCSYTSMAYVAAFFYFMHYPLILTAMALGNKLLGLYVEEEVAVDGPVDEEVSSIVLFSYC